MTQQPNYLQINLQIAAFLKSALQVDDAEFGAPLEQIDFSRDLNAAIRVAALVSDRASRRGYWFQLEIFQKPQPLEFTASFQKQGRFGVGKAFTHRSSEPAIAICLAVLKLTR